MSRSAIHSNTIIKFTGIHRVPAMVKLRRSHKSMKRNHQLGLNEQMDADAGFDEPQPHSSEAQSVTRLEPKMIDAITQELSLNVNTTVEKLCTQ